MFVCSSVECKTRKYSCGVSVYRGLASFSPQLSISQAKQTHHPINLSTHDFLKWVYYLQGTFNAPLYDISGTPLEPACKVLSHLCLQSSGKPVIWQPFHLYNAVLLWVCIATYLSHFHIHIFCDVLCLQRGAVTSQEPDYSHALMYALHLSHWCSSSTSYWSDILICIEWMHVTSKYISSLIPVMLNLWYIVRH